MNCYISRNYKGVTSAGNKAKTDVEKIMESMAFCNIGLPQTISTNEVYSFFRTLAGVIIAPFRLHKGDCLVLQYPVKKYFTYLCDMAHLRGAHVIVLIHDLGSFRRKALTVKQEIDRLSHVDYIIAANSHMKSWLEEQGCKCPIGTQEVWDYISSVPVGLNQEQRAEASSAFIEKKGYRIIYAGALSPRKNSFLYQVGDKLHSTQIILYGKGFDVEKASGAERFSCQGFVQSDELIAMAKGDFGLIWDGDSTKTCSGNFGEYLRYNNPHKTSLYLRCGLPVIIWSGAALADFVRENKVGLCLDSLDELENVLKQTNIEEYAVMKANALQMQTKLQSGYYMKQALNRALNMFPKK
jgi:hypothetical protein